MNNWFTNIRDRVGSLVGQANEAANNYYQRLLPKLAEEYAKAGMKSFMELAKDLVIDAVSGATVIAGSIASGTPDGLKAISRFTKGVFWDLPRVAYWQYQQSQLKENEEYYADGEMEAEEAAKAALRETAEDFSQAGDQFVKAVSTTATAAIAGLSPVAKRTVDSLTSKGGELVTDTASVTAIMLVEGAKFTANQVISPLVTRMVNATFAFTVQAQPALAANDTGIFPAVIPQLEREKSKQTSLSHLRTKEQSEPKTQAEQADIDAAMRAQVVAMTQEMAAY